MLPSVVDHRLRPWMICDLPGWGTIAAARVGIACLGSFLSVWRGGRMVWVGVRVRSPPKSHKAQVDSLRIIAQSSPTPRPKLMVGWKCKLTDAPFTTRTRTTIQGPHPDQSIDRMSGNGGVSSQEAAAAAAEEDGGAGGIGDGGHAALVAGAAAGEKVSQPVHTWLGWVGSSTDRSI